MGGTKLDAWNAAARARPPAGLRLDRRLRDRVLAHLMATAPLEAVGLLAIEDGAAGTPARAVHFFAGTNIDASPTRYTMDPAEVVAALQQIEANGWRLGAIVHSHPATPAAPSETDLREAHYPDSLLLIVSLAQESPVLRAWRIVPAVGDAPGSPTEVPLVIDGDAEEGL